MRSKSNLWFVLAPLLALLAGCDDGIQQRHATDATVADTITTEVDGVVDVTPDAFEGFLFGPGVTGNLEPAGSKVEATGSEQLDLEGAAVSIDGEQISAAREVTISGNGVDIVPEGFIAGGPAVRFAADAPYFSKEDLTGDGMLNQVWIHLTLPLRSDLMPTNAAPRHLRIFTQRLSSGRIYSAPFSNIQEDLDAGRVTFRATELGVFQLAVAANAGQPYQRHMTYRSITGISMGAGAALMTGLRFPDKFDSIGALGGAADWIYLSHYLRDQGLGGFCNAPAFGANCPPPLHTQEHELSMSFNGWHSPSGEGNGGSFDRTEYVRIFRDLAYAFGNTTSYNPESPYRPAGVPRSELLRPEAERCLELPGTTFTIATGYFDDEYNPDGTLPVIAFCDGEDGAPNGFFDDSKAHDEAVDVLLAVDLDGDGRRDANEPVIRNSYEPYEDLGSDGLASKSEAGYDPMSNPDPADDDYDWLTNPHGSEGNWLFDEGEPYQDFGLDGVEGTSDSPYDFGEGNAKFDYNPNLQKLFEESPRWSLEALDPDALNHLTLYVDGGVRDLFNFDVAGLQLTGALQAAGGNVRMYDTFNELAQLQPGDSYNITRLDFDNLGDHVFMRYGDPYAALPLIEDGDGKHVGSNSQAVQRFTTMFGYLSNLWVNGDYTIVEPPYTTPSEVGSFISPAMNGATVTYGISLPPNYDKPEFANVRYPVLYLLHGYGQGPEDLPITGVLLANFQAIGQWPKSIIVFPEGFCGKDKVDQCNDGLDNDNDGVTDAGDPNCATTPLNEAGDTDVQICNDGLDNDGDGMTDLTDKGCKDANDVSEAECVKGTFFSDHVAYPDGEAPGPAFESAFFDLVDHVGRTYRVKAPEDVTRYY